MGLNLQCVYILISAGTFVPVVAINHAQTQVTVDRSHPGYGRPIPPRSRSTVPTQVTVNRSHPGHGQPFPPRSRPTVPTQVTVYKSIPRSRSTSAVPGYGQPAHPRSRSFGQSYVFRSLKPITGSSSLCMVNVLLPDPVSGAFVGL